MPSYVEGAGDGVPEGNAFIGNVGTVDAGSLTPLAHEEHPELAANELPTTPAVPHDVHAAVSHGEGQATGQLVATGTVTTGRRKTFRIRSNKPGRCSTTIVGAHVLQLLVEP